MKADSQPIRVYDMRTLELEKARLARVCRSLERKMGGRAKHVRKNFMVLALNGMFPGAHSGEGNFFKWISQIVKVAWSTGRLQSVLMTLLIAIAEFLSVRFGIKFLTDLFSGFGKEKKRKEEDSEEA